MAWFREEMVVFRSTFDSPGFRSFGAPRDPVAGEGTEEQTEEFRVTGRTCQCGSREIRSPLADGITRSFETDAIERGWSPVGGFGHEGSDGIVGDEVHVQFAQDHRGCQAAEDIHAQGDFDVAKK